MPLTDKQYKRIKDELESCKNPLFFFDDDPDGLVSFVLLYKHMREGKGVPVKTTPRITTAFMRKVDEYSPDKIFVLDTVRVDDDFIEQAKVPIVWIDHHEPQETQGVQYFNPLLNGDEATCTSDMCYNVLKNEEDLWLAGAGIVADWQFTDTLKQVSEKYPELLPADVKTPEKALFETKLGKLARIFSFMLMGDLRRAMTCVKILTRINDPFDILDKKTSEARFIYKRYAEVNNVYQELLKKAIDTKPDGEILLFTYSDAKYSLTKDLSNELLYRNPDKVIIINREKNGEMKMSLRSGKHDIRTALEKSLAGVDGFGGGHEHACGAVVKKEDFAQFMKNLKESLA